MPRIRTTPDAEHDMTPMIDVVFLLIIFFLCIDFRTLEARLPAYLPRDHGVHDNPAEPVEQLAVRIHCDARGVERPRPGAANGYRLEGHLVHWEARGRRFTDLPTLREELGRIARAPESRVADASGRARLLPVVLEAGAGVTYGDVAATLDTVQAAGFDEIRFGGGR